MKNVVIFSGGTGSIAIQNSIKKWAGDLVNVDIVISAYDNGKSTGDCRRVMKNSILGPSDLRKNQATQFYIQRECTGEDAESQENANILNFLEYRILQPKDGHKMTAREAFEHAREYIMNLYTHGILDIPKFECLTNALIHFFFEADSITLKKGLDHIVWEDFSISNMVYAGLAGLNENRLSVAGSKMASILGIKDNVHVISDDNLYLYGLTENNNIISDEGLLVEWKRPDDKIKEVKLLDTNGLPKIPAMSPKVKGLIQNADIIILSSGTLWSSLVPTYMHAGLKEAIYDSHAEKYMVINNIPDKDMYGCTSKDLISITNQYIDLSQFKIIYNKYADSEMRNIGLPEGVSVKGVLEHKLSSKVGDKTHNTDIFKYIMRDYFEPFINNKFYLFDFDDTIFSRNQDHDEVSYDNILLLSNVENAYIISGNSISRFRSVYKNRPKSDDSSIWERIFKNAFTFLGCSGGNSVYSFINDDFIWQKWIDSSYVFTSDDFFNISQDIIRTINSNVGQAWEKKLTINEFESRDNCMISIKPIYSNRDECVKLINKEVLEKSYPEFIAHKTGHTTIDITKKTYNKCGCVKKLLKSFNVDGGVVYIGDEIDNGNDSSIKDLEKTIKLCKVKDVYDTNLLLKALKYGK